MKVSILTHLLFDPYTVTYHAASLLVVYDLHSLTQPLAYIISPFWHIIPQPVPKRTVKRCVTKINVKCQVRPPCGYVLNYKITAKVFVTT